MTPRDETARGVVDLIAWAAGAAGKRLPPAIRRRAAVVLADDLGAMVVATRNTAVRAGQQDLLRTSHQAEATVFAAAAPRADRLAAATANGLAVSWCELDEGYRSAPCHAGAYTLPVLLAEAETNGLSVSRVLSTLAIAYEVTSRAARAFPFKVMTVHPHAAFVTIGAAAASALARGADARSMLGAVTGAASMTFAGPFKHAVEGVMVRNAWTSAGAWIGMQAVDWAARGISGIPETLHDVFVGAFGTGAAPAELTAGLGAHWAISDGYHKVFSCCQYTHSMVEASLELHARLRAEGLDAAAIDVIDVETHPLGLTLTTVEPATDLAARFSMPHAAAATAVFGGAGQESFSLDAIAHPGVAALRPRVRLLQHPDIGAPPQDRPARVTWRLRDGRNWSAECRSARGGADRPFDEATLRAKFEQNTMPEFPAMARLMWDVVEGVVDEETPWRDLVARMTMETPR